MIIVTGNGERKNALKAVAAGAYDFCEKPVEIAVLRTIIERGLNLHRLEEENRRLAACAGHSPIDRIVTAQPAMLKVCRDVEKLATTNVPVLLLGESGTGKEALAQALHELGPRAKHRSSPSIAARFRKTCWKASCSAMSAAPSPAR